MENATLNEILLVWVNQGWANPYFDFFFSWISAKNTFSFPLIAIIWLLLGRIYQKSGWLLGMWLVITILLGDYIGNTLKHLLDHPRPCLEMYEFVRSVSGKDTQCASSSTGMPSNHSLNFFLFATFLSFFIRKRSIIFSGLTLATLVAISRVYLAAHYPAQVLVGAFLGAILGILAAMIIQRYSGLHFTMFTNQHTEKPANSS